MPTSADVVREYWRLMTTNQFEAVAAVLAPDFVLPWPQSGEIIRGADRYVRMNQEYPAHGVWTFTVHKVVGGEGEAVSDVSVSDGVQQGRALSFFTVEGGRIHRLVEFWPEPFAPAEWRRHLVEVEG